MRVSGDDSVFQSLTFQPLEAIAQRQMAWETPRWALGVSSGCSMLPPLGSRCRRLVGDKIWPPVGSARGTASGCTVWSACCSVQVLSAVLCSCCNVRSSTTGPIDAVSRDRWHAGGACVFGCHCNAVPWASGLKINTALCGPQASKTGKPHVRQHLWRSWGFQDSMSIVLLGLISIRKLAGHPLATTPVGLYVRALKVLILVTGFWVCVKTVPPCLKSTEWGRSWVLRLEHSWYC